MRRCKNIDISSVFSSQKTSIALIWNRSWPRASRTYVSPLLVPGTKMYALPTEPVDKSYALCPRRIAPRDIGNRVGRKRRKIREKPQRTSSRQKYWMTRHALFCGHRSRFCFSPPLIPFISFRYILRTPGFQPTFCFALERRTTRRERDCITRDHSPNFVECHETLLFMENKCGMRRRKNAVCEVH